MKCIVFNPSKHHLASMIKDINNYAHGGEDSIDELIAELKDKGLHRETYNGIVDIYEGDLTVEDIKAEVLRFLEENNIVDADSYNQYIETHGAVKRRGITFYTL